MALPDDVAAVVTVVRQLREENAALRDNFAALRELHAAQGEALAELQGKHAALRSDKHAAELQMQEQLSAWRGELEAKQRAFEELTAQVMNPRELEVLRVRLAEELEVPHQERYAALESEAAATREVSRPLLLFYAHLCSRSKGYQRTCKATRRGRQLREKAGRIAERGVQASRRAAVVSRMMKRRCHHTYVELPPLPEIQNQALLRLRREHEGLRAEREVRALSLFHPALSGGCIPPSLPLSEAEA